MPLRTIRNSSSFRLALSLSALFACALAAVFVTVYFLVGYQLRAGLQSRVESEWTELLSDWKDGGFDALQYGVRQRTGGIREDNNVLVLQNLGGEHLAGNADAIEPFEGHREVRRGDIVTPTPTEDVDATDTFYLAGAILGDYFAAVGESDHDVTEVQETLVTGFAIGLFATTLLTLTTGFLLSRRMQTRVVEIRRALERIASGNLGQVIPGSDSHDDVGEIVRLVNCTVGNLRTVMDSVQQISNDIAHDLKKPLGRLQRQLALAARCMDQQGQARQHLALAQQQAKNIQNVFEALLRIAQIESGARRSRFRTLDVTSLLHYMHETFEPVAREAGHQLMLTGSDMPITIRGDEELLTQLFVNLIENGICHTPAGSTITLAAETTNAGVSVSVSDNGPGIREADREVLTQRFFRGDKSRSDGGCGLGLSLVAAVASLHDARLQFEDTRPGLIVSVTFPNGTLTAVRAPRCF